MEEAAVHEEHGAADGEVRAPARVDKDFERASFVWRVREAAGCGVFQVEEHTDGGAQVLWAGAREVARELRRCVCYVRARHVSEPLIGAMVLSTISHSVSI